MKLKIGFCVVLIVLVIFLSGCLPSAEQNYLAFRQNDISANVSGRLELTTNDGYTPEGACPGIGSDGRVFEFKADIQTKISDEGKRASTVKFTYPPNLNGFEINYFEGGATFTQNGDKNVQSGEGIPHLQSLCDAFFVGNSVISVNPLPDGKVEVYLSDDGKTPIAIYTFEKGAPFPTTVRATTEKFKIELFDIEPSC